MKLRGPQALALTFFALISIGTGLLMLPAATKGDKVLDLVDAVFLSTSAVCVTGLATINYADDFSTFGHYVLLALFQLGGLGIMTFSAALLTLLGREVDTDSHRTLSDAFSGGRAVNVKRLLVSTVAICLLIEGVGALALYAAIDEPDPSRRAWLSIFHSVSAFCNAGFSLYPDSLVGWRENRLALVVVMGLIVAGGLGFFVILNLIDRALGRTPFLRVQTRMVIVWTVFLIALGAMGIHLSEHDNSLSGMSAVDAWLHSIFQSVTARTAGFNTVDFGQMRHFGLTIVMVLMFIGGGPGSTAGGIKVTTFGIVVATVWSHLRGRDDVEIFRRRIPRSQVQRAFIVASLSVALMAAAFLMMRTFGDFRPSEAHGKDVLIPLGFETISAFCTVGLSTGIAPELGVFNKSLLCVLMFVGRLGPLTLAVALAVDRKPLRYRLPAESVMVG